MFHHVSWLQSPSIPHLFTMAPLKGSRTPKNCADAEATEPATIPTAAPRVRILVGIQLGYPNDPMVGFMEESRPRFKNDN